MLIVLLIGSVLAACNDATETQQEVCTGNLERLGRVLLARNGPTPNNPPYSGSALLLYKRKTGKIPSGQEETLLCPADPRVHLPMTPAARARYDEIDPATAPRELCSYAGRNHREYPLDVAAPTLQILACCPHHPVGALVLLDDGNVVVLDREDLGVEADAAIPVGQSSRHELLRRVTFGSGSE